jgi:hypothetical protein
MDTGEFIEGFCVSKYKGYTLTHKVRVSTKLDLLRIGEPVLYDGTHGTVPRSLWMENGTTYVSAGPNVYEYTEKSWDAKVRDMVDALAYASSHADATVDTGA